MHNNYQKKMFRQAKIVAIINLINSADCDPEDLTLQLNDLFSGLAVFNMPNTVDKDFALINALYELELIILGAIRHMHPSQENFDIVELMGCVTRALFSRLVARKEILDKIATKDILWQRCNVNKHLAVSLFKTDIQAYQLRLPFNSLYPNIAEYYHDVPSDHILDLLHFHTIAVKHIAHKIIYFSSYDPDYDLTELLAPAFFALNNTALDAIRFKRNYFLAEQAQYSATLQNVISNCSNKINSVIDDNELDYMSKVKILFEIGITKCHARLHEKKLTSDYLLAPELIDKHLDSLNLILQAKSEELALLLNEFENVEIFAEFEPAEIQQMFAAHGLFDDIIDESDFVTFIEAAQFLQENGLIAAFSKNGVLYAGQLIFEACIAPAIDKYDSNVFSAQIKQHPELMQLTIDKLLPQLCALHNTSPEHMKVIAKFLNKLDISINTCADILEHSLCSDIKAVLIQKICRFSNADFEKANINNILWRRVKGLLELDLKLEEQVWPTFMCKAEAASLQQIKSCQDQSLLDADIILELCTANPNFCPSISEILIKKSFLNFYQQILDNDEFLTCIKDLNGKLPLHHAFKHHANNLSLANKLLIKLIWDMADASESQSSQRYWNKICTDNSGKSIFHALIDYCNQEFALEFFKYIFELNHKFLSHLILFASSPDQLSIYRSLEYKAPLWSDVENFLSMLLANELAVSALQAADVNESLISTSKIFDKDQLKPVIIDCLEKKSYVKLRLIVEARAELKKNLRCALFELAKNNPEFASGHQLKQTFLNKVSDLNQLTGPCEYIAIQYEGDLLLNHIGKLSKQTGDPDLAAILNSDVVMRMLVGHTITDTTSWMKIFSYLEPEQPNDLYNAELATLKQYVDRFKMNPEATNSDGNKPFELAIMAGRIHLLRFLCEVLGVIVDKIRLLHCVCTYNSSNPEIIQYVCSRYDTNCAALGIASTSNEILIQNGTQCLQTAVRFNKPEKIIKRLFAYNCLEIQIRDIESKAENIFHFALNFNNRCSVVYLMMHIKQKYDEQLLSKFLNQQDINGKTPSHLAAAYGKEILFLLMKNGALATIRDNNGKTAFAYLPAANEYEVIPQTSKLQLQ